MGTEHEGSFRAHANYVRSFALLAGFTNDADPIVALTNLRDAVVESQAIISGQRSENVDLDQVRKSLVNAWGTELLLGLAGQYASEKELVNMANNWGVVQVYYVAYHATQALAVARGAQRPDSHSKTQRVFATHWVNSAFRVPPWSLAADHGTYRNANIGREIDERIHPWSRCTSESCWDLACLALRTTREDAIPDAIRKARERKRKTKRDAWTEEERARISNGRRPRKQPRIPLPRLTQNEREETERGVRIGTIIDYLYRLRIKANYEDALMFLEGPQTENESRRVLRDLSNLAASTMLVHELMIGRHVGQTTMNGLMDGWFGPNFPQAFEGGLQMRRSLFR